MSLIVVLEKIKASLVLRLQEFIHCCTLTSALTSPHFIPWPLRRRCALQKKSRKSLIPSSQIGCCTLPSRPPTSETKSPPPSCRAALAQAVGKAGHTSSGRKHPGTQETPGNAETDHARRIGTPRFGIGTSEYGRNYRLGYGLTVLQRGSMSFELGIEGARRESSMQGVTDHGALARLTARW